MKGLANSAEYFDLPGVGLVDCGWAGRTESNRQSRGNWRHESDVPLKMNDMLTCRTQASLKLLCFRSRAVVAQILACTTLGIA